MKLMLSLVGYLTLTVLQSEDYRVLIGVIICISWKGVEHIVFHANSVDIDISVSKMSSCFEYFLDHLADFDQIGMGIWLGHTFQGHYG